MSKPYISINSVTYSSSVLTVNYNFGRLRGLVTGGSPISVYGFSNSISFTNTSTYGNNVTATFSVNALGTASGANYSDPTAITWTFGGTPSSTTTNARLTLGSTQLSSYTSSTTVLATFLSGLATSLTGIKGVAATATSTTLVVSVPNTGNLYNGTQLFLNLTQGASSIVATANSGVTNSGTYSGGSTTYNVYLQSSAVNGAIIPKSTTSFTASVLL